MSCGWAQLPLFHYSGGAARAKHYELRLHAGTPFEAEAVVRAWSFVLCCAALCCAVMCFVVLSIVIRHDPLLDSCTGCTTLQYLVASYGQMDATPASPRGARPAPSLFVK